MNSTTAVRPLETRLVAEGYTPEQIARLQALRDTYPIIEQVRSRREMDQLMFLRWCHATGRVDS